MSNEFLRIGQEVGHFVVGKSLASLLIMFYVVYYFAYLMKFEKDFVSWRETRLNPAIDNLYRLIESSEVLILTILFATLVSRNRSSLYVNIASSVGVILFGFAVNTGIQLTKYNPTTQTLYHSTVNYIRDRSYTLCTYDGLYALLYGTILGYVVA